MKNHSGAGAAAPEYTDDIDPWRTEKDYGIYYSEQPVNIDLQLPRWSRWYPRIMYLSSRQVMDSSPGESDVFSNFEFFLSPLFSPVDSAKKRVYTAGKRWLILFPQQIYQSVPRKDGNGRPQGEENLVM